MQDQFEQIQDPDNEYDYSKLESENFENLLEIFEKKPTDFLSSKMKKNYEKLGEFDLIDHIVNKRIIYDKTKKIQS